jgi:hypothetical protein
MITILRTIRWTALGLSSHSESMTLCGVPGTGGTARASLVG